MSPAQERKENEVPLGEARAGLAAIVDGALLDGRRTVLTRFGRPVAFVAPMPKCQECGKPFLPASGSDRLCAACYVYDKF